VDAHVRNAGFALGTLLASGATLLCCGALNWYMCRVDYYAPGKKRAAAVEKPQTMMSTDMIGNAAK